MTLNKGAVCLAAFLPLVLAACGDDAESDSSAIQVSASTTQVADLAANVGGGRAEVRGILPVNADPHDYEPQPSDAEALLDSDLVLASGGDLDIWLEELEESSGTDAPTVVLMNSVETIAGGHEEHAEQHAEGEEADPHWWQDPRNAILAVDAIKDALIEADPDGAAVYEENAETYIDRLSALDRETAACFGDIPPDERKLVTSHDSLGYFAERYGIEFVGAAVPALTTQAQPSAGETADLVELIEDENVQAVFPEAGLDAGLEEAIAGDAGVTIGGELWADTLGPDGSGAETYIDAMAANAATMVEGLTAGRDSCEIDA